MSSLTSYLRLLRLKGFDTSTAAGRADERQRRAHLSALTAMTAKVLSMTAQLVTIPLALNYLGTERFGVWATLSSLLLMLSFADFGIGNGLLNAVADAYGRGDKDAIRRNVSSAFAMLLAISLGVFIIFVGMYPFVRWDQLFNVNTPLAIAEVGPAMAVMFICLCLNIPATVVQRLQLGLQMGFVANGWQALGSVLSLLAVLAVIHARGGLADLILAFAGAPLVAVGLNAMWFFGRAHKGFRPRRADLSMFEGRTLVRRGMLFLVLQIVVSVTYLSDSVVIAHVLGAASVTQYAIPEKLFSFSAIIVATLVQPLWPAYAEALSRGDHEWVRRILRRSLYLSGLLAAVICGFLLACGPAILRLWTGRDLQVPLSLLAGLALWKVIEALGTSAAAYMNGSNLIKEQLLMALATAAVAVCLKFWLAGVIGIAGPVWATIVAYLFCSAPIIVMIIKRSLRVERSA